MVKIFIIFFSTPPTARKNFLFATLKNEKNCNVFLFCRIINLVARARASHILNTALIYIGLIIRTRRFIVSKEVYSIEAEMHYIFLRLF